MEVGLRVVRGPDWKWGNQDSGEGHVGTVVEIGKPSSSTSPDKTVVVQWDSGSRTNYRVGYHGQYDLRILDNAPTGVKHQNIICDFCKKTGIQGMRWKCTKCHDFDLCTECYMADKHDLGHAFQRFETASSKGVKMPKRKDISNSNKIQSFGIFPGAKVVRGPDWDWGNQDGGEGKVGKVTDIRGWDSESGRSVAHVTWTSGSTNVYRVGHKGKVDLKVNTPAPGIFYYREHLPVLGEFPDPVTAGGVQCAFKVGDKVQVDLEPDILKAMQEGHGGWNPRMADYIGCMGTVHRITDRGDVRVQYDGCSNRWTFHAGALTKVQVFNVDDIVIISDNIHLLREKQKGHGEWTDSMKPLLGQVGKVVKRYPDGDLRVEVRNQVWTLNPACCFSVQHKAPNMNNTNGAFERVDTTNKQLMEMKIQETGPDRLVREAAQGHTDIVRDIVSKFKDKVDLQSAGKTALQVAAHQGHKDIVQVLLNADCNLELRDEDGDTALHYSAFGNQAEVMEMLIMKGANINSVNNGGCSTLHVAVNKQHVECVSVLLRHKCNVNIQDSYGDTALHDAIGKESREIMEMLISVNDIDFSLKNKRGFNVLHHAALKGNNLATEKILAKCRQIVDVKKDDGFSAIHLAALNGHREVTHKLLSSGRADIEIRNNRQQTPLLLAVAQGHMPIIELLIEQGANVNVEDEDGDSCLHLSLMKTQSSEMERTPMMEAICADVGLSSESQDHVGLACYLAQQGADIYHKNHQGKTALDVITDDRIRESVRQYANDKMTSTEESEEVANCIVCDDQIACIQFFPCQHMVTCLECSIRAKKCLQCKTLITSKKDKNGEELNLESSKQEPSSTALRRKLAELEENVLCSICMERRRNMAFMCGHSACKTCGDELKNCHMCRKVITKRIVLYI